MTFDFAIASKQVFYLQKNVLDQKIQITNDIYFLDNSYGQKILKPRNNKNYLINLNMT